jgi:hypothetical protein
MKRCNHCGSTENITRHHVLPVRWWNKRTNKWTVPFCNSCHENLETIISIVESITSGKPIGSKVKLKASEYETIVKAFTRKKYETLSP